MRRARFFSVLPKRAFIPRGPNQIIKGGKKGMISGRRLGIFAVGIACLSVTGMEALAQQAPPQFSGIVLFGDSLSDTGNVRSRVNSKSSGAVDYPSHTFDYDNGRFTNDDQTSPASHTYFGVWHEQLARSFLGVSPATFSLGGGLNYAFGGATTVNGTHQETAVSTPFGDVTITVDDMGKQMDDYLGSHVADPNALYIVWGGSNDLRNDDSAANVTATAARATALVSRLANAGAHYILVPNVVPLGDIPAYSGNPAKIVSANIASAAYRDELNADLAALRSSLAAQGLTPVIYLVDEWADAVRIFSNGPRFGFSNISNSCQNSSGSPDHYVFWDDKHPTTAGHFHLANTAFNAITGPSPSPAKPLNLATRVFVDTGERVAIAGFIVTGDVAKKVLIRGMGPSLSANGVPTPLANPTLTLFDSSGNVMMTNDDWMSSPDAAEIMNSGLAPTNGRESAMIATLGPGQYTAQLAGKDGGTGNGVIEIYDMAPGNSSTLANLSTRGFVGAGDNVMIGGIIIGNGDSPIMVFRAMGPSLSKSGIVNPLQDPTLELHDGNGSTIAFDDDWAIPQVQAVRAVNLAPPDSRESAIVSAFLSPGQYTAIVRGKNNATGVALIESYRVP
jgi:phospholipase/lecithinase/hemolysin